VARAAERESSICLAEDIPVFVLAVFAKNEKSDLSAAERNVMAKMVDSMIKSYRRHK
jgi:hypothetical protein